MLSHPSSVRAFHRPVPRFVAWWRAVLCTVVTPPPTVVFQRSYVLHTSYSLRTEHSICQGNQTPDKKEAAETCALWARIAPPPPKKTHSQPTPAPARGSSRLCCKTFPGSWHVEVLGLLILGVCLVKRRGKCQDSFLSITI